MLLLSILMKHKENARRKRNFLKQCKKRVPRAKLERHLEKAQFNGLDQKLFKDDRVHQGNAADVM